MQKAPDTIPIIPNNFASPNPREPFVIMETIDKKANPIARPIISLIKTSFILSAKKISYTRSEYYTAKNNRIWDNTSFRIYDSGTHNYQRQTIQFCKAYPRCINI